MSERIPLSAPCIDGNEWTYVKDCLDTGWVSSAGRYVERFEEAVRDYTGAGHAVACINGTAALHIALIICGVRPGDEVIVPTVTFIAPVNTVRYAGAFPLFMDCDEYYNIDTDKVMEFILKDTRFSDGATYNARTGRRIAALLPVHVFGNAARLQDISALCRQRRIPVIEDATESLGTWYTDSSGGRKRHTGLVGRIGCISFNGNKIITTGGGGMIVTDSTVLARRARYLTTQAKDDELYYVHKEVGYNYRMSNVNAAIGVAQLEKLPRYLAVKRANYVLYQELLTDMEDLCLAGVPPYAENNLWMYALQIGDSSRGKSRDRIIDTLQGHGVETRPLWYPNHLQKPYRQCQAYRIEKAMGMWRKTLNIPCSVDLSPEKVTRVVEELRHA